MTGAAARTARLFAVPPPSAGPFVEKLRTLQPQELVIGLFGEYVREDEQVWAGGLAGLLQELNFSPAASRIALNRLVTRGMLRATRSGKFVNYSVTPRLSVVLDSGRRRTFAPLETNWDGTWTLVWYAMPKELQRQRARLARWLGFWGFGPLQDGTWATPANREAEVSSLIAELGLARHAFVMRSVLSGGSLPSAFARRMWNLDALKVAYDALAEELAASIDECTAERMPDKTAFAVRTRAIEMFRETVAQDPRLPDRVLEIVWRRDEVYKTFGKLHDRLKAPAQRHFRSSTRLPVAGVSR